MYQAQCWPRVYGGEQNKQDTCLHGDHSLVLDTESTVNNCFESRCPALDSGSLPRACEGVRFYYLLSLLIVPSSPSFFFVFSFFLPPSWVLSLQELHWEFPLHLVVQLMGCLLPLCQPLPASTGWSQLGVQSLYLSDVSRFHIFGWARSLRRSESSPDALSLLLDDFFKGGMFKLENCMSYPSPNCAGQLQLPLFSSCLWRPEPVILMLQFKYGCSIANPLSWSSYNSPLLSQLLRTTLWYDENKAYEDIKIKILMKLSDLITLCPCDLLQPPDCSHSRAAFKGP